MPYVGKFQDACGPEVMDQDTCYRKGTEAIQLPIAPIDDGFWRTRCVVSHAQIFTGGRCFCDVMQLCFIAYTDTSVFGVWLLNFRAFFLEQSVWHGQKSLSLYWKFEEIYGG